MQLDVPGFGTLDLEHLVMDFNGTIARDGILLSNMATTLKELAAQLTLHVVTADTGGTVAEALEGLPCRLQIIKKGGEAEQKEQYVRALGQERVVCLGNGANDRLMLKAAALGIVVLEGEGAAISALQHADIVTRSIYDAMGLLMIPRRIVATLRS